MSKVIVTCGPSIVPIDEVRRITNSSTGELGVRLSETLAMAGHEVLCLKGRGATWPGPGASIRSEPFDTNEDLLGQLRRAAGDGDVNAVFHVAALGDFQVAAAFDASGTTLEGRKFGSREGRLTLELEPAPKLLPELRTLFPGARLVGWKYELDGDRHSALARAWQQIQVNGTDACVVNGAAFGSGFGFCEPPDSVTELPTKAELANHLAAWLAASPATPTV